MAVKAYIDHAAVFVSDLDWHVKFFDEVLDMKVKKTSEPGAALRQVWLEGGVQLIAAPNFAGPEGRLAHIGLFVDDLDTARERAHARGAKEMPQGKYWFSLPDGLCVEMMPMP